MTAGDHVRLAMQTLPGLQELEAKTIFTAVLRKLYSKHKWSFLIVESELSTVANVRAVEMPDIDWGRDYFWWDPYNVCFLPLIDRYAMMGLRATRQGETGRPEAICRGSLEQSAPTVAPVVMMEFGPPLPDAVYTYPFAAFRKPTAPTSDGDYPLWPEAFEDVITLHMEIEFGDRPSHRIAISVERRREAASRLGECMRLNDGGAEILRIKQTYSMRSGRSPFQNIRIAPASPGGSTDWNS